MGDNLSDNIIEVRNVKKVYRMGRERICAVDDVSFSIRKGEFCCLFGVSGSGKSTLLNLMAGIEKLTSGQVIIKGKNIRNMSEKSLAKFRQNNLGFVFQSYNLMNSMTALENVELPMIFKHVSPRKRKKLAREMLTKVGLKSRMRHKPKEMSGGQQQRVGIARAFVDKPEIVFADEPTGNLDSKTSKEVMDLIKEISRKNNETIVMVTHDRRLAEYADKIIHIFDGKIQRIELRSDNPDSRLTELNEQDEMPFVAEKETSAQDAGSNNQEEEITARAPDGETAEGINSMEKASEKIAWEEALEQEIPAEGCKKEASGEEIPAGDVPA
jgi:putative ABC transport system ATP-binding protein